MGGLFKTPKMPKPPPEVAMPDPEDLKARMARRSAMMDAQKRKGREGTILTPIGGEALGSGSTQGGPR